jgi:hypothetical protein
MATEPTLTIVLVAAIVAVAAATQSVTGFGFALVVVPIVAALTDPKTAVVMMTAVGVPMSLWNTVRWRRDLQVREAITVTIAALVGMPLGLWILVHTDERTLRLLIGVVILVMTAWLWRGLRLPRGRPTEITAGAVSGALATSTGTSGPPLVIAYQAVGMTAKPFRATLAATFFVEGVAALAVFWSRGLVTSDVRTLTLVSIPAMVIGVLAGDRAAHRFHGERFRPAVLLMLVASGLVVIATAIR